MASETRRRTHLRIAGNDHRLREFETHRDSRLEDPHTIASGGPAIAPSPLALASARAERDSATGTKWSPPKLPASSGGTLALAASAVDKGVVSQPARASTGRGPRPSKQIAIAPEPPARFPEVESGHWDKFALSETSIAYSASAGGTLVVGSNYLGSIRRGEPYLLPLRFRGGYPLAWGTSPDGRHWTFRATDGRGGLAARFAGLLPGDDPLRSAITLQSEWRADPVVLANPVRPGPIVYIMLAQSESSIHAMLRDWRPAGGPHPEPDMLVAMTSIDGGRTFSQTHLIDANVGHGFVDRPDAVLLADNTIWITWIKGDRSHDVFFVGGRLDDDGRIAWFGSPQVVDPMGFLRNHWIPRIVAAPAVAGHRLVFAALRLSDLRVDRSVLSQVDIASGIYGGAWAATPLVTTSTPSHRWPFFTFDGDTTYRSASPMPALAFDGESIVLVYGRPIAGGTGTELVVRRAPANTLDGLDGERSEVRILRGSNDALLFFPQVCSAPGGPTAVAFFYSEDRSLVTAAAIGARRASDAGSWDRSFDLLGTPFRPRGTDRTRFGIPISDYTPWPTTDPATRGPVPPPAYEILTRENDQFAPTSLGDYLGLAWVPPTAPLGRGAPGVFYCAWGDQLLTGTQASQIAVQRFEVR